MTKKLAQKKEPSTKDTADKNTNEDSLTGPPVKKPAAKRGPRKTTAKNDESTKATTTTAQPTAIAASAVVLPISKQKKTSITSKNQSTAPMNTLMNYIKPGCNDLGTKPTMTGQLKPRLLQKITKNVAQSGTNLVNEPPRECDLTKLANSQSLSRARLAELDVKKLIDSWRSDADDFELFDLNMNLSPNKATITTMASANGIETSPSLCSKTKSIIERYEKLYIGMEHELAEEAQAENDNRRLAAGILITTRQQAPPTLTTTNITTIRQAEVLLSSSSYFTNNNTQQQNLTNEHLNSIINDTIEIGGSSTNILTEDRACVSTITIPRANTKLKPQITMETNLTNLFDDEDQDDDFICFAAAARFDAMKKSDVRNDDESRATSPIVVTQSTQPSLPHNSQPNRLSPIKILNLNNENNEEHLMIEKTPRLPALARLTDRTNESSSNKENFTDSNSTSTPIRSKLAVQRLTQENPSSTFKPTMHESADQKNNASMIGMTQAMALINSMINLDSSIVNTKSQDKNSCFNDKKFDDKEATCTTKSSKHGLEERRKRYFNMKINLIDLFCNETNFNDDDDDDDDDDLDGLDWDDIKRLETSVMNTSGAEVGLGSACKKSILKSATAKRDEPSIVFEKSVKCKQQIRFNDDIIFDDFKQQKFRDDSDYEGFTQVKTKKKKTRLLIDSMSDESRLSGKEGINQSNNQTSNFSDDEEFAKVLGDDCSNSSPSRDHISTDESSEIESRKKEKRRRALGGLILDEAEDEDDDYDDDDDEDDENRYDLSDSFVDNDAQNSVDDSMMAFYQKSVQNMAANNKPSYLNRPMRPITDDIFSQMPSQDLSYMHDSFVVSDDHVSFQKSKKSKKKTVAKMVEKNKRKKSYRIDQFNENADRIQTNREAATSSRLAETRTTRTIKNRHLLLDSQYEPILQNINSSKTDEILILDDEENVESRPKTSLRLCKRLNQLDAIEDKDSDECEVILDKRGGINSRNQIEVYKDKKKNEVIDEDDEDIEINQWLINETFS